MKNTKRNFGLDLMRAVAITLVVVSHFSRTLDVMGVFGVELFFVLSGFLIGGILLSQVNAHEIFVFNDLRTFFYRRWLRTLPNYFLFLLLYGLFGCLTSGMVPRPVHIWPYLIFLQNFATAPPAFYMISWSLSVEEWFYLIFPLLFFVIYRCSRLKRQSFVAAMVSIMVLPLFARLLHSPQGDWNFNIRMVVIYRLDALMFGVFMALVRLEHKPLWPKLKWLFWPGLVAIVVNFIVLRNVFPIGKPLIPTAFVFTELPIFCAFLLPFTEDIKPPVEKMRLLVENISKWSYSIYLSHFLILFLFYGITASFAHGFITKLAIKIVALITAVYISRLVYLYFEKPIMDLRKKTSLPEVASQLVLVDQLNDVPSAESLPIANSVAAEDL